LEKRYQHVLLLAREFQVPELLSIDRLRIFRRRPAGYLLTTISRRAPRQRVASVVEVDHFLERLEVSVVHVRFHEIGARALGHVAQRWRFVLPGKRLGHRRPFATRILRAGEEAAYSRVEV